MLVVPARFPNEYCAATPPNYLESGRNCLAARIDYRYRFPNAPVKIDPYMHYIVCTITRKW